MNPWNMQFKRLLIILTLVLPLSLLMAESHHLQVHIDTDPILANETFQMEVSALTADNLPNSEDNSDYSILLSDRNDAIPFTLTKGKAKISIVISKSQMVLATIKNEINPNLIAYKDITVKPSKALVK